MADEVHYLAHPQSTASRGPPLIHVAGHNMIQSLKVHTFYGSLTLHKPCEVQKGVFCTLIGRLWYCYLQG
jgi:hypothetical protein